MVWLLAVCGYDIYRVYIYIYNPIYLVVEGSGREQPRRRTPYKENIRYLSTYYKVDIL